jgi:hypothetical protein
MKPFKFFQPENKQRYFTNWLDRLGDRRLGGIRPNNPPIDERYPEYYNTDEFVFFDVTQVMFDPESYVPYKFMLFRHIEDGNTVQGQRIHSDHPMYNFPDII